MSNHDINYGPDRRRSSTTVPETSPPVCGDDAAPKELHPEFIRLPKPTEKCPWTGLSRGSMNELILGPNAPVRSVVIKQIGASRGIRLVHFKSLLDHLHTEMEAQRDGAETGEEVPHA